MAANATDAVSNGNLKDLFDNVISKKLNAPAAAGSSGQVLTSDGSGGTAWATVSDGNVPKRTLGPDAVLTADDAFAAVPLGLKVYGNTRQNLWVNPSGTRDGITVTANDDGSFTVSGASSNTGTVNSSSIYTLKPNTRYTLSVDKLPNNVKIGVNQRGSDGGQVAFSHVKDSQALTFTTEPDMAYCYMEVGFDSGVNVSATYRVMLNEGDTAEPWCPPGLNSVNELEYVFEDVVEHPNAADIPIDLQGNELCSLPNGTRDVLDVVTGEIEKNTVIFEPDGSENWAITGTYASTGGGYYYLDTGVVVSESVELTNNNSMSDRFAFARFQVASDNTGKIGYGNSTYQIRIRPYEESIQNAESLVAFKQWLADNRPKFILPLKTPEESQLTPPELHALPSPNVTAYASANVEAESEMEYIRDINVVLGKLESAVIATASDI